MRCRLPAARIVTPAPVQVFVKSAFVRREKRVKYTIQWGDDYDLVDSIELHVPATTSSNQMASGLTTGSEHQVNIPVQYVLMISPAKHEIVLTLY